MTFNIENYQGKYAMHVKTEEEAKEFCKYLNSVGRKWHAGGSYITQNKFEIYEENTIYYFNEGLYGACNINDAADLLYMEGKGYTVLKWSDFQEDEEKVSPGDIIDILYDIILELNARESSGNIITEFSELSWDDLCDWGTDLLNQLKNI